MQGRAVASSLGLCVCVSWLLAGCAADTGEAPSEAVGEARAAARPDRSFTVDFSGCSEMASLTPVLCQSLPSVSLHSTTNPVPAFSAVTLRV